MATWLSGMSKQLRTIRKNVFAWCGIFLLIFFLLMLRLFWLQVVCHEHYRLEAERYHNRDTVLPATRGRLLDRNLAVLALDDQRPSLYVDPTLVQAPEFVAQQLAPVLGRPAPEILADITRELPFVWVKRHLEPEMCAALTRLALPELQLKMDGSRYRIGVELAQAPQTADFFAQLARSLGLSEREVRAQLGVPERAAPPSGAHAPAPAGQRWVRGIYDEEMKHVLQELKLPGLIFQVDSPSYSLGLDPRVFTHQTASLTAPRLAARLAPILKMTPTAIEAHLQSHPRFVWLKRNISPDMAQAITRMQGTVFVVTPGALPDAADSPDETEGIGHDVDRLYKILNDKGAPEQLARAEIRRRLQPGAAPGPLGVKLVNGQPSLLDERSLLAKPIPGVVYGLVGVSLQHERRRSYPFNNLASATLGFVTYDNHAIKGTFGLERSEEQTLRGVDGREVKEVDARHITIPEHSQRVNPVDGCDVVLTLDLSIQQTAEEELSKAVEKAHAVGGECLVMDPNNGEILAMASAPTWNSNAPAAYPPGTKPLPLINPIVSNFYEPGSTFKVATVMASLEEGVVHDGEIVTNCTGAFPVGNRIIHEARSERHGEVDCGRLLEQSCNIGAANLSLRLGATRFLKWCRALGFGKRTGIEVPDESPGSLNARHADTKITLANMGFGQSLAVTPLQMLAAYSSVANGGFLVKPHVIKARMRRNGTVEAAPIVRTNVCSPGTAALIRGYLERVVTKGTGKAAAIPGYRVAGKTGTAQKAGPHGYRSGSYISSFIGIMPADKPRLVIITIIDEPHAGSIFGGAIAAPVVQAVGQRALQYLNILPTEIKEKETSDE